MHFLSMKLRTCLIDLTILDFLFCERVIDLSLLINQWSQYVQEKAYEFFSKLLVDCWGPATRNAFLNF